MRRMRNIEKFFLWLILFFILLAVAAVPVSFWPHYEKKVYLETVPLTEADVAAERMESDEPVKTQTAPYGVIGYPYTGEVTKITGMDDLENHEYEIICLETDVKNLKATGFYERMQLHSNPGTSSNFSWKSNASKGSVSHSSFGAPLHCNNPFGVLWSRTRAIYAQYYVLTLEDKNRVFLLLNDTAVPIPRSGTVKLPLAKWKYLSLEYGMSEEGFANAYGVRLTGDQEVYVLDAATNWGMFYPGLDEAYDRQGEQAAVLVITGIVGVIISVIILNIILSRDKSLNRISSSGKGIEK